MLALVSERLPRLTFGIVTAAYVAVLVYLAFTLPERVPMHFDGGQADDWDRRGVALGLLSGLGVFMLLGGALVARYATGGSGMWLNMPHKDYWLAPGRRTAFRRRFEADMLLFVALTGLLLIVMMLIIGYAADHGGSAPNWWFWTSLAVYVIGTIVWVVWFRRHYRPPAEELSGLNA